MFASDDKVVEEGEDEVEYEASPDCDVVENCPVRGVQGHLILKKHMENGLGITQVSRATQFKYFH